MNDSAEWVTAWLADLLGPGTPGMKGPAALHDRQCTELTPAELPEQLRELRRPILDGVPKNGRYAIVYKRRWNGRDAVWLETAEYEFGMFGARSVFVQPVRRAAAGALLADGEPTELAGDHLMEPASPAIGVTARAVADSVRTRAGHGLTALVRRARPARRDPARRDPVRRDPGRDTVRRNPVRERLAGMPTAFIVAVWVGVLLLGVMSAMSLTELASSSRAAARSHISERAAGVTAPLRPAATAPARPAAPRPAPTPTAAHATVPGDLGLALPMSRPACDGGYGVIVANATRPGSYRQEISGFLARFPEASYLLAEQACSSLRAHTGSGASIYAVYYGPYAVLGDACARRSRVGGGSYIRRLDNGPESSLVIRC